MNPYSYAIDMNIKHFESLLVTSLDQAERETIQVLLTEERAKARAQLSEPKSD